MNALARLLDGIFMWAWNTSLAATVLIALVLVAQIVLRRFLSARWLYALWFCVLLRLLLPIAPPSSFSVFNLGSQLLPQEHNAWAPARIPLSAPSDSPIPKFGQSHSRSAANSTTGDLNAEAAVAFSLSPGERAGVRGKGASLVRLAAYVWFVGALCYLTVVLAHHRKLSAWLNSQQPLATPRMVALIEQAKALLHLQASIHAFETNCLPAPSLFGFWKPRLLLPKSLLENLPDNELRLIILHELVHLKRKDVLLNWLIILTQALHWFNPLVWFAFSRFRAARELVCDAAVLSPLNVEDRQSYGATLIKMIASRTSLNPSLIPMVSHEKQIHRRITMIANFKPTPRLVTIASAFLLIALACFTFTRAAEKPVPAPPAAAEKPVGGSDLEAQKKAAEHRIVIFEKMLAQQDELLKKKQAETDKLKKDFGISAFEDAQGTSVSISEETLRKIQNLRIEALADFTQIETLRSHLQKLSRSQLRKSISTASPDAALSSLMDQQAAAEQKLAELLEKFAPEHPDVKSTKKVLDKIDQQIENRLDGILEGLGAKAASFQARMAQLEKLLEKTRSTDIDTAITRRSYFQAKRDLETMQAIRERLLLRLQQEKVDAALAQ